MAQRRFAAILSVDVVGYSRMMQTESQALLKTLNEIYNRTIKPCVSEMGGRIVKLMGDGALMEFPSAYAALDCAITIQKAMRDRRSNAIEPKIAFRIGAHAGDVLTENNDLFGDAVNVAARLQAAATPGGILVSGTVRELVGGELPAQLIHEGTHQYKNIDRAIVTFSVDLSYRQHSTQRAAFLAEQDIRFATTRDGVRIAWTENGKGPTIVKAPNWIGHLELDWRNPSIAPLIRSIAGRARLVRFDARANGLSDWDVGEISLERLVDDLEAIFDAAAVDRAPVVGISQGCAIAIAFAARARERVSAMILVGGYPQGRAMRNSPVDKARAEALQTMMEVGWDDAPPSLRDLIAQTIVPGASVEARRQYAEDMRAIISPENLARYRQALDQIDVTDLLPLIDAPTLVLHSKGDRLQPLDQGRRLAAGLPNARLVICDSDNHCFTEDDPAWPKAEREIHNFLDSLPGG